MDPWAAEQLARELMAQHKLSRWTFSFNRRRRSMGLCIHGHRRIELSLPFVQNNDEALVRDTILHEIAHALVGFRAGHGPRWVEMCRRVGAKPERCGQAAMPEGSWRAVCGGCGRTYHRYRRPRAQFTYNCRSCGRESGRLSFRHVSVMHEQPGSA